MPTVPAHCDNPYHLFYLVMPTFEQRQALIRHLDARGVHAVFHYVPLHLSEMGRDNTAFNETIAKDWIRRQGYYPLN